MKIKVKPSSYKEVAALPAYPHKTPKKSSWLLRTLIYFLAQGELKQLHFHKNIEGGTLPKEPCLILMNHSSFIDLKIASDILYPRPFHIVCTDDGFVGKEWLMRGIGCIPTQKFITDATLVKDMMHCKTKLNSSILLFPEASYSFDGTATPLPQSIGKLIKLLKMPVVMIKTSGAFTRDPLYNNLQLRNVDVSADVKVLYTQQQLKQAKADEIQKVVEEQFTFDHFKWQRQNGVRVTEPFRADCLNRMLYKCPHCGTEGKTQGKGTRLVCKECGVEYELDELGILSCLNAETKFDSVPAWYRWERECVKKEIQDGTYVLDCDVQIYAMKDMKQIYQIGGGHLAHSKNGFVLDGEDGLHYEHAPQLSYSLYSDFYWYELGDIICIGDHKTRYYCVPQNTGDVVAKARLATEEIYKLLNN